MNELVYERVYSLPRILTAKEIIGNMSCEELKEVLVKAGNPYKLEELLGFTRFSIYKYLKFRLKECFYTANEYSKVSGIPYATLVNRLRKGRIPSFRYAGKYWIPKWLVSGGIPEQ